MKICATYVVTSIDAKRRRCRASRSVDSVSGGAGLPPVLWRLVECNQRRDSGDLGKKVRIVKEARAELLKRFAQLSSSLPGRFMFDNRAVCRSSGLMICEERVPLREQWPEAVIQYVDSELSEAVFSPTLLPSDCWTMTPKDFTRCGEQLIEGLKPLAEHAFTFS